MLVQSVSKFAIKSWTHEEAVDLELSSAYLYNDVFLDETCH